MDEGVCQEIILSVQYHVDAIVYWLELVFPRNYVPQVCRMGSREYGCAGDSSDLDLYLMVPDAWKHHAKQIRILLGDRLATCKEAKDGRDAPVDQASNCTLKWTSTWADLDVSLLVAVKEVTDDAVSATNCLLSHFMTDAFHQEIVGNVLCMLREKGVLNSHGRKAKVEQSLKTTPAALLCVAVMQGNVFCRDVSFADPCMRLLNALAVFDATAFSVHYDWNGNYDFYCMEVHEPRNDGCPPAHHA